MTAKDKAKELVDNFNPWVYSITDEIELDYAKKCAVICVDEILKMFEGLHKPEYCSFDIYEPKKYHMEVEAEFNGYTMSEYWEQVKIEINEL